MEGDRSHPAGIAAGSLAGGVFGFVDGFFWSGGLPTGALVDLATTGQMVVLPTGEYADELASKFGPYYLTEEIPAGTYQGQTEPSPQVVVPNVLIVRSEVRRGRESGTTGGKPDPVAGPVGI